MIKILLVQKAVKFPYREQWTGSRCPPSPPTRSSCFGLKWSWRADRSDHDLWFCLLFAVCGRLQGLCLDGGGGSSLPAHLLTEQMEWSHGTWPSPKNHVFVLLGTGDPFGMVRVMLCTWTPGLKGRMFLKEADVALADFTFNMASVIISVGALSCYSGMLSASSSIFAPLIYEETGEISCQVCLIFSLPSCINSSEMLLDMQINSEAILLSHSSCLQLIPKRPFEGGMIKSRCSAGRWCSSLGIHFNT